MGLVAVIGVGWPVPAVAGNDDMIDPDNVDHYVDRDAALIGFVVGAGIALAVERSRNEQQDA